MSVSATWQVLPEELQQLVMTGDVKLVDASEVYDLMLLTPEDEVLELPPRLQPVLEKLMLLEVPVPSETRH